MTAIAPESARARQRPAESKDQISLRDKVKDALNEARMLVLGAQVLLGFQYSACFQPGFQRLSPLAEALDAVALALMLMVVMLVIAPASFHHIAEKGEDTWRLQRFTTCVVALALAPFAASIGIDLFVVAERPLGRLPALAAGAAAASAAGIFWFGIGAARLHGASGNIGERKMDAGGRGVETPLKDRIDQMLTESRVVLPGVQALLGFQFTAILTDSFEKLPRSSQMVHLASLGAIAIAVILLMAPAPYHRITAGGEDTPDVERFGVRVMLAAMPPLAFGLTGDLYIVLAKITGSSGWSVAAGTAALILFATLWLGLPLALRRGE